MFVPLTPLDFCRRAVQLYPSKVGVVDRAAEDVELLEVLLSDAALVGNARTAVGPDEIKHPGLKRLLEGLQAVHAMANAGDTSYGREFAGKGDVIAVLAAKCF
jgi:hypothetical protein